MKNLLFISGTRADYNKLSTIIKFLSKTHNVTVLLVDMHGDKKFGRTVRVVEEDLKNQKNITVQSFGNKDTSKTIDYFAWLVCKLEKYYLKNSFDMIFVHGDRMSALAGALVASYNNIPVCHIEAGDVSGSIDQNIRYAITKFAHRFLVTNEEARQRVLQLGENEQYVFNIGNTSIVDIENKNQDNEFKKIMGDNYCILIYHPITTDSAENNFKYFKHIVDVLNKVDIKVLLIESNNDKNFQCIHKLYNCLNTEKFVVVKNLEPRIFYNLLMNSKFLIGNSSAGICEAPYLGVYSINIGVRQQDRSYGDDESVFHVDELSFDLEKTINHVSKQDKLPTKIRSKKEFEGVLKKVFTNEFFEVDFNKKFHER